jgi:hypothetical protein
MNPLLLLWEKGLGDTLSTVEGDEPACRQTGQQTNLRCTHWGDRKEQVILNPNLTYPNKKCPRHQEFLKRRACQRQGKWVN